MAKMYKKPKKNSDVEGVGDKALADATSVITEGDREFANRLKEKYGEAIGLVENEEPIGDYVFSLVDMETAGIVDIFFANELTYSSIPRQYRNHVFDRVLVRYDEEIINRILRGNREQDEILVAVFSNEKIGRLMLLKYREIAAKIYYEGFEAKREGSILVLRR